jgi:hypothetical protein
MLPVKELAASLAVAPRSVGQHSMQRFLEEARRYCGSAVAGELDRRLTPSRTDSAKHGGQG